MKTNDTKTKTPDPKLHATYDPRERIRNLAGTEPETREDDNYQAKAQAALTNSTPSGNGLGNT